MNIREEINTALVKIGKEPDSNNQEGIKALNEIIKKWSLPSSQPEIIAMVVHKDVLYVATSECIYAKDGNGNFIPLPIK